MERVEGLPVRASLPGPWAAAPETHGRALEELIDALVSIHAVDWGGCGLEGMAPRPDYLARQTGRWLDQLASYEGRELPAAGDVGTWLDLHRPKEQEPALCHGD
jgi:aminoglycoside phosphotransferase (APT) family kinase protein